MPPAYAEKLEKFQASSAGGNGFRSYLDAIREYARRRQKNPPNCLIKAEGLPVIEPPTASRSTEIPTKTN